MNHHKNTTTIRFLFLIFNFGSRVRFFGPNKRAVISPFGGSRNVFSVERLTYQWWSNITEECPRFSSRMICVGFRVEGNRHDHILSLSLSFSLFLSFSLLLLFLLHSFSFCSFCFTPSPSLFLLHFFFFTPSPSLLLLHFFSFTPSPSLEVFAKFTFCCTRNWPYEFFLMAAIGSGPTLATTRFLADDRGRSSGDARGAAPRARG